ncbi:MAG: hypothetical protein FJY97_03605 [candidate division Zixibacteria bacterium]|nr:hypothetical protein [candidate division Zixibacteria bacterium]
MASFSPPFDTAARAARHAIVRDLPSVNFFQGALMGNGGMGVVVCVRPDAVMMHFGHNNVWDIRTAENHKDKFGTFQEIFERVKAIPDTLSLLTDDPWYAEYLRITADNYRHPYPRPFPCGTAVFAFDRREVEAIGYRLDIGTGVCEVELRVGTRRVFLQVVLDMKQDRVWVRTVEENGNPIPAPFNRVCLVPDWDTPKDLPDRTFDEATDHVLGFRQTLPFEAPDVDGKTSGLPHPKDRAFRLRVAVNGMLFHRPRIAVTGVYEPLEPAERWVRSEMPFVGVVNLDEGLTSAIPETPIPLSVPDAQDFETVFATTRRSWRAYWQQAAVALDDPVLEEVWYRNLYFLHCTAKPGVACPGLFGNWSYKNIGTPWHGDYHMNYNTQQPFWGTFSSNHVEKHLPYTSRW